MTSQILLTQQLHTSVDLTNVRVCVPDAQGSCLQL